MGMHACVHFTAIWLVMGWLWHDGLMTLSSHYCRLVGSRKRGCLGRHFSITFLYLDNTGSTLGRCRYFRCASALKVFLRSQLQMIDVLAAFVALHRIGFHRKAPCSCWRPLVREVALAQFSVHQPASSDIWSRQLQQCAPVPKNVYRSENCLQLLVGLQYGSFVLVMLSIILVRYCCSSCCSALLCAR